MGQGVHTVLQQIACEELGLPPERVAVVVDTERELETGQTTASRSTVLGGSAVIEAAREAEGGARRQPLESSPGRSSTASSSVDWTTHDPTLDEPVTHIAYGWATQVVILDDDGRIEKVVAAHDVGKAINPTLVEGQIEGGVHMGLGQALSEEFVVEGGVPVTETLKSLHIIPPTGMPEVECILVEEPQPEGPYGAKGIGEAALVPTAARGRRRAVRVRRHPPDDAADEGLARGARRRAPPREPPRMSEVLAGGTVVTVARPGRGRRRDLAVAGGRIAADGLGRTPIDCSGLPRRPRQRLRAHAPLLGARARDAVSRSSRRELPRRSSSASGGGSTARSTRSRCAPRRSSAGWRRSSPARRRSSTTTRRRTRSTARST